MRNRIAHAWAHHTDQNGEPHWPASTDERDGLASRLFGACLVTAIDGWLDLALDQLHREQTPEWRRAHGGPSDWEKDRAKRALFAAMTQEQRDAVQSLLVETIRGAFFSTLVKLDQFPAATSEHEDISLDITVQDLDAGSRLASVMDGDILELHDRLQSWLDEFSEHAALFQR